MSEIHLTFLIIFLAAFAIIFLLPVLMKVKETNLIDTENQENGNSGIFTVEAIHCKKDKIYLFMDGQWQLFSKNDNPKKRLKVNN